MVSHHPYFFFLLFIFVICITNYLTKSSFLLEHISNNDVSPFHFIVINIKIRVKIIIGIGWGYYNIIDYIIILDI